jgi:DNA-binding MarR family transcriptional regulator
MMDSEDAWNQVARDGSNLHVKDFLSVKLTAITVLMHRKVTKLYLEKHAIGLSEWRMLTQLIASAPISAVEVNQQSGMDKGQISRALTLLSQRALVERSIDDKDARRQILNVTRKGRQLFERIMSDARQRQAQVLTQLSVADRRSLLRLLSKISEAAERMPVDCDAPPRPRPARKRRQSQ